MKELTKADIMLRMMEIRKIKGLIDSMKQLTEREDESNDLEWTWFHLNQANNKLAKLLESK